MVWECGSLKSPRPDGVNFGFTKEFWDTIKGDFIIFLVEFHVNGKIVRVANSAFIVLVQKHGNPKGMNDFRPISLIGCMTKVLSKLLAKKLKGVLHKVISSPQSAFIEDRQMVDRTLISNELVDEAKRKKLKLYYSKSILRRRSIM